MLEIRPSDVMAEQVRQKRNRWQSLFSSIGQIGGAVYEAQRVAQVNRQLAYLEQAYQEYNESLPLKAFDSRGEERTFHPSGGSEAVIVQKPFGQASIEDVEADEQKFFQAQLDYITRETTNKVARREMIQHLTNKHLQNKAIIYRQWSVAADHEAKAGFNALYDTVMASNDRWEEKVLKISSRVDQMVAAGRLWKDEGETIKSQAAAVAQYSYARNGAMAVLKETGGTAPPAATAEGMIEAGNIGLANRPQVRNADGTVSTVRTISIGVDGREVLIPTVSEDGRILSDEEATAQYQQTGKHLGVFDTPAHATAYAQALHESQQAQLYGTGLDAAERWLAENTPFYEGNLDARAKVLADVRQEFEYFARKEDEKLDVVFADLHIQADTVEKADLALDALAESHYYNGNQKYVWEQRLLGRRDYLERTRELPKKAVQSMEDQQKAYEDLAWGLIAIAKANGVPLEQIRQMSIDLFDHYDAQGNHAPRVRGTFVKQALEYLDAKEDPALQAGVKFIQSKTAGLDDREKMRATSDLLAWYKLQNNPSQKDIEEAANNIVKPIVQRNLNAYFKRGLEVFTRDEWILDEIEQLTGDIQEGKYIGLVEKRQAYLNSYNAALFKRAREDFPAEDISSVFTDSTGQYGGKPGTAILFSRSRIPYAYKLEGKKLVLYRLAKTRGGDRVWQEVAKKTAAKPAEAKKTPPAPSKDLVDRMKERQLPGMGGLR